LDGVTVWPRIEAVLDADDRELVVEAKINFYVFMNASLSALLVGLCLVIDKAVNIPQPAWEWALYAIPFLLSYIFYRGAIPGAIEWGDAVRSSIDVRRLELYEKLGVRAPTSSTDERQLALRVNQALLYGHPPLRDDLWRNDRNEEGSGQDPAKRGFLSWFRACRKEG
jgi:hypothetical protein